MCQSGRLRKKERKKKSISINASRPPERNIISIHAPAKKKKKKKRNTSFEWIMRCFHLLLPKSFCLSLSFSSIPKARLYIYKLCVRVCVCAFYSLDEFFLSRQELIAHLVSSTSTRGSIRHRQCRTSGSPPQQNIKESIMKEK